jgi:hypothetical protein
MHCEVIADYHSFKRIARAVIAAIAGTQRMLPWSDGHQELTVKKTVLYRQAINLSIFSVSIIP